MENAKQKQNVRRIENKNNKWIENKNKMLNG